MNADTFEWQPSIARLALSLLSLTENRFAHAELLFFFALFCFFSSYSMKMHFWAYRLCSVNELLINSSFQIDLLPRWFITDKNDSFWHLAHSIQLLSIGIFHWWWKWTSFQPFSTVFPLFDRKWRDMVRKWLILTLGSFDSASFNSNIPPNFKMYLIPTNFDHFPTFW